MEDSFQIERVLGAGGYGTVYAAVLRSANGLERRIALKVVNADQTTPANVARLRDEARLLSTVKHRAVIGVLDLVELPQGWAVVMELADGLDLATILAHGAAPPRAALQIVAEIASALHAMWHAEHDGRQLELVHRDLKPSNLVVTPVGEVKILDFGLAISGLLARESATATDMVVGTMKYMAPERFHGANGAPSDVYSLGVILLDLLRVPFGVSGLCTPEELSQRLAPALRATEGVASAGVAELVTHLLAFDANDRPTALEVSRACRKLAAEVDGPDLADWAMSEVDALMSEITERLTDDPMVGATLEVGAQRPPPTRLWVAVLPVVALLFAAGAAIATFVVGGLAGWGISSLDAPQARPELIELARLEGLEPGAMARTVSADGTQVAYTREGELYRQVLGQPPERIEVSQSEVEAAMISPDGQHVAYSDPEGTWLLRGDGTRLALEPDALLESWHASSDRLLLLVPEEGTLVVADATTGSRETLDGNHYIEARWAGDDVLADTPDGIVRIRSGRATRIADRVEENFSATVDGAVLLATDFDGVRSRLLSGRPGEPLGVDATFDELVAYLGPPAGDRFVLVREEQESRARLVEVDPRRRRAVGEKLLSVPRPLSYAVLLPEGDRIAVSRPRVDVKPDRAQRESLEAHTVIDLDGRVVEDLGTVSLADWFPVGYGADGRTLYVKERDRDAVFSVKSVALDAERAPERLFTFDPGRVETLAMSPDGQAVAVTDSDGTVLVVDAVEPLVLDGTTGLEGWEVKAWTRQGELLLVDEAGQLASARPGRLPTPLLEDAREVVWVGDAHVLVQRSEGLWALHLASRDAWPVATIDPEVGFVDASATADLSKVLLVEWRRSAEVWTARYALP
ncbi:MAG: serine/threonine protein kinase [Alphaproteobacteria bacterium]|nr:serine/threonine protein kinase [Alphaproteobacteria bacterium]